MKRIDLIQLKLRNFKGIRDFVLDAEGENADVFGNNAAGKTTLFDSFLWQLFDKDSQNKKDFAIKTLDASGKVLHGLEHEVEGTFRINGRRVTLRKVYSEKWTKKRGSASAEFTGHTTDYFVEGVPKSKGEYEEFIARIIQEDVFKLITNPVYFNEMLKKEQRRKILLDVCGDLTDAEVIAGNMALSALPAILGDRSIDDHRKVIAARRAKINEELGKIPVRIDEAERSKPDTSGLNEAELQFRISALKIDIESKEAELSRIQSGGEIAVKEKRLREIESEMLSIQNELQAGTLDKLAEKRKEIAELRRRLDDVEYGIRDHKRQIQVAESEISHHEVTAGNLRQEWNRVNAEAFNESSCGDVNCPTCKQPLPSEQIAAARGKALDDFNFHKAERLEAISKRGKQAVGEVARYQASKVDHERALAELIEVREARRAAVDVAEAEQEALQASMSDVASEPRYIAKRKEAEAVKAEIQVLRNTVYEVSGKVREVLGRLKSEVAGLEQQKSRFIQVRTQDVRIAELSRQEKTLAAEYEQLEQELYLTEEFIRTKVAMLESKINSKFRLARFKLFDQQINGGLNEVCETMYRGVPYSSGLNRGHQIIVGLDIINTLSEHYGITAPIFIDNAEAVSQMPETIGQQIRLIVPPSFDKLPAEARERLISFYGSTEEAKEAWTVLNNQLRVETEQNIGEAASA